LVLLSRVWFLPQTLWDIDSTNFARAPRRVRPFAPSSASARLPGVRVDRQADAVRGAERDARAGAALGSGAALLLFALLALFRSLLAPGPALAATLLTITNPRCGSTARGR
jgi:hypothetical protein